MKTVTIKQIQEIIDPKARWIAMDSNGCVCWFCSKPLKDGNNYRGNGNGSGFIGKIKVAEFEGKNWTECCVELEPDYREWVGKLCKFWNEDEDDIAIGKFWGYSRGDNVFAMKGGDWFKYCRPVKPDEVEFVK